MKLTDKHIILIGFKHVGKSVIGRELAKRLDKMFFDLDQQIEICYEKQFQAILSCRQIMQNHGDLFFRKLEKETLHRIIHSEPSITSLGGGSPLYVENAEFLSPHLLVHIRAPRDEVFKRIMASGQPAFFSSEQSPLESFNLLWKEREKVYRHLANFSIDNTDSVAHAVDQILKQLKR
jgi:shikimate kinase